MSGRKVFMEWAESLGLYIDDYAPGDGVTRYRVFTEKKSYFAGDGIFTALGLRELRIFLRGYSAGLARGGNHGS